MKISVLKNKNSTSSVTYRQLKKVADILESSQYLEKIITDFRKKYNFPPEGYPFKFSNKSKKRQEIIHSCCLPLFESYEILNHFKLPRSWVGSIIDVFIYNTLSYPNDTRFSILPMSEIGTEDEYAEDDRLWAISLDDFKAHMDVFYLNNSIFITINQKCTKDELKKYIDNNWEKIELGMQKMAYVQQHNFQRIDLAKEITDLRDGRKMKFSGIADLLANRYESDQELHDLLTEDYVKNLYARWKKKRKSINK